MSRKILLVVIFVILFCIGFAIGQLAYSEDLYTITAYCPKECCCGRFADGVTASGKEVKRGMVACNIVPFGTKLEIEGKKYVVEDRGSKKYFDKQKRIDIYFETHEEAVRFGVRHAEVRRVK